jgi:hypothetical protein
MKAMSREAQKVFVELEHCTGVLGIAGDTVHVNKDSSCNPPLVICQ